MKLGNNVFSIKDLENFSGIKAHTIRIWEKRYNILVPARTDSNIRTYNESELKKLLNISYLNRNGFKISRIARFDDDELSHQVMKISSSKDDPDQNFHTGKILMSAIKFSEEHFTDSLTPYLKDPGMEKAYLRYFYPLLEKSTILWQTGSLSRAQEQFIRNTVKSIIIIEDNKIASSKHKMPAVAMINNSENYRTDANFLFFKYILKKRGFDVIFTGGILPPSEVNEIYNIKPFDYLLVFSDAFNLSGKKTSYYGNLAKSLKIKKIFISDSCEEKSFDYSDNVTVISSPVEFVKIIDRLS